MNLNTTSFFKILFFFFSFKSLVVFSQNENKTDYPNIIVFLVDDMGLMDTSTPFATDEKGHPIKQPLNSFYITPHMEKLAAQGVKFTNFYAHSVCSPTRTSLMTGQNSARHRVTNWVNPTENNRTEFGPKEWNWNGLTKNTTTLPKLLKEKGYKTIHVGKGHFGPINSDGENPLNLGFDINIGGSAIGRPGSYYGKDGFGHIKGNKDKAVPGLKKYHRKDIFLTEALTIEANAAISACKEQPFFLYMSHYAVHSPFQPDPRFIKNYQNSNKSEKAQAYASLVEGIDKSLGDIIAHVKKLDLGENTLIIFMGDNGSTAPLATTNNYGSSKPFKGKKGNHWDGGTRVPFIASWITPNKTNSFQKKMPIIKNTIQQQLGTVIDVLPTLCELANIKTPKNHVIDGYCLQKQLKNKRNLKRDEIFLNHFPHGEHNSNYFTSIINANWKLIYHYPIDKDPIYELYNIQKDPFETTNLASKKPKELQSMVKLLIKEMAEKNGLFPEKKGIPLSIMTP